MNYLPHFAAIARTWRGLLSPWFVTCAVGSAFGCASQETGAKTGTDASVTSPSGYPAPASKGVPRPTGAAGNLSVLNWAGFTGAVSYTFDDTNSSQIAHFPALRALGVRMTFYLITGKPEINDPTWKQALADGHELGNHTRSHSREGTLEELDAATETMRLTFGVAPTTMAAPYGESVYSQLAKERFFINRGVANGLVAPNDNTDPFTLYCYIPSQDALAGAFNQQVESARTAGKWRLVLLHGFTGGSDGAYQPVAIDEFVGSVEHAKALGDVWIDTVENIGAYWLGQKAFAQATQAVEGTSTTWSWELPAHFPSGKYLRVKVDGGTLEQNGRPLAWDDHGYYEVSLDAKSLKLSP